MFFFVLCLILDRTRAPRFDLVVVLQSMPDVSLQHCLKLLSSKGGWVLAMHRSPFALPLLPVSCCKALPTPRTSFHNQAVLLGIDKDHPAFRTRFVRHCCMVFTVVGRSPGWHDTGSMTKGAHKRKKQRGGGVCVCVCVCVSKCV